MIKVKNFSKSTTEIIAKSSTYKKVLEVAKKPKGEDKNEYRREFIDLVKKVEGMKETHSLVYEE